MFVLVAHKANVASKTWEADWVVGSRLEVKQAPLKELTFIP
jgi:hypothetical protein